VHSILDLIILYILPSSQIGDSWRKDVVVFTIQPKNMHINIQHKVAKQSLNMDHS